MERKPVKEYIDYGFGFPVVLQNINMVNVRGEWTPDINYKEYEETLIRAMPTKPFRLTGAEIKFIRLHFGMTLQQFADRFGLTRQGVMKWENLGDKATPMAWGTEKDIRLFVLDKKEVSATRFHTVYAELAQKPAGNPKTLSLRPKNRTKTRANSFQASYL